MADKEKNKAEVPTLADFAKETNRSVPIVESNKDTVEVSKADLTALVARIGELESNQAEILKTAPSDQIARIESLRRSGKLVKAVKIRFIDGKPVIGWKMVKDDIYFEGTKLVEIQTIRVAFTDGTTPEMSMRDFTRKAVYSQFEVIREAKDADGEITLTVLGPDGQELAIGQRFVN